MQDALEVAASTWQDVKPVVHYSESRQDNSKPQAHSDYLLKKPLTFGVDVDIMLECKAKELALLKLRGDDEI